MSDGKMVPGYFPMVGIFHIAFITAVTEARIKGHSLPHTSRIFCAFTSIIFLLSLLSALALECVVSMDGAVTPLSPLEGVTSHFCRVVPSRYSNILQIPLLLLFSSFLEPCQFHFPWSITHSIESSFLA